MTAIQQVPAPPPLPDIFGPTPMDIAVAVIAVVGTVGVLAIAWTLVRGLLRKWSQAPAADHPAVEELRATVHRLGAEVAELQERLDFAERMLARGAEPARIEREGRGHGAS